METSCKIIELYGLPGCGKTTLCTSFKARMPEGCVADINDMFREARQLTRLGKIRLFPLRMIYPLFALFFTCPIRRWGIYRSFLKRITIIYYIKKTSQYPYVILDHGFLQCVHSLYLGIESYFTPTAQKRLVRIMKILPPICYDYCRIPIDLSIERIKKRNNVRHGRLDVITDRELLMDILQRQEHFFDELYRCVSQYYNSHLIKKIDMCLPPESLTTLLSD